MRNLIQLRATDSVTAAGIFGSLVRRLERGQSHAGERGTGIIIGCFLYVGILGAINLRSASAYDFELLYLAGVALGGWLVGARAILPATIAAGILMAGSGWNRASQPIIWPAFCCNAVMHFVVLASITWFAAWSGKVSRQLRHMAQDRAGSLQTEVEEHKETATRLREALDLFGQAMENINEVFWVTDTAKIRTSYVSRGFEKVFGRPRKDLYTASGKWLEAVHDEDRDRVARATHTKQITGDYDEEYRIVRPDGSVCWVHDRAFPVRNEKGEVYRIVGITEDITERKRAEQLLQAHFEVGTALILTSDLKIGLQRLLETAAKLEGIDCGGVYLVDPAKGGLNLAAHTGLSDDFVDLVSRYEAGGVETSAMMKGGVRYIVCGAGPVRSGGEWRGERLRALTSVPLHHKGAVVGALNLGSHGRLGIPAPTRVVIETIAAQAAGAIARIRAEESLRESEAHLRMLVTERFRLEGEILEISDREKGRIGQDIHDGLCQQLVGAAFDANALQQALSAGGRPEAATARTIYSLLDEAITESRRVSRGLYPVRLETEGLAPALQELATNTSERFNIPCRYEPCASVEHCEVATATHLYRIAQEAVNNAVKHSGAKNISIGLTSSADGIDLEVRDDGKGLTAEAPRGSGMGLHIMDYRAKSIGANLQIRGGESGTIVSCRLPKIGGRTHI
jgi:PAS domain S-box-containing protein